MVPGVLSGTIGTVTVTAEIEHGPGQPRSERDAAFLKRFDAAMRLPIIVSAILPLIVAPESHGWVGAVIGVTTWLVFLIDYVVHVRHLERYGRTGFGRFDLFVVIATAPWFLLPGTQAGGFVVLLRLARLARLAMATKGRVVCSSGWAGSPSWQPGSLVTRLLGRLLRRARHQPGVRHLRRRLVVGHRHPDHRRLRRHRPQDHHGPMGRDHDHDHRDRRRSGSSPGRWPASSG